MGSELRNPNQFCEEREEDCSQSVIWVCVCGQQFSMTESDHTFQGCGELFIASMAEWLARSPSDGGVSPCGWNASDILFPTWAGCERGVRPTGGVVD